LKNNKENKIIAYQRIAEVCA